MSDKIFTYEEIRQEFAEVRELLISLSNSPEGPKQCKEISLILEKLTKLEDLVNSKSSLLQGVEQIWLPLCATALEYAENTASESRR